MQERRKVAGIIVEIECLIQEEEALINATRSWITVDDYHQTKAGVAAYIRIKAFFSAALRVERNDERFEDKGGSMGMYEH